MVSFIPVFFMCNFVSMRFSSWSQSPRSTLGYHSFSSAGPACFPHLQTALRIHNLAYMHALLPIVPLLDPSGESGKLSTFLEDFPPFSVFIPCSGHSHRYPPRSVSNFGLQNSLQSVLTSSFPLSPYQSSNLPLLCFRVLVPLAFSASDSS